MDPGGDLEEKYGYRIEPYMDPIYQQGLEKQLYDYMSLISDKVLRFQEDLNSVLESRDIHSRGQCAGAPCDILSACASLDIPEGEAMLYEPEYNSIPASAAVLDGSSWVSAESFTCIYGWPDQHMREERTAELKMVADALLANGLNHLIWHGKPHGPLDKDTVNFYAPPISDRIVLWLPGSPLSMII